MSVLADVNLGDPHAAAHNDERDAINQLTPPATTQIGSTVVDRPSGVLKALTFLGGYGNSLLANHGNAGSIWFDRLIATLQPVTWFNAGVGGYTASDVASLMYGSRSAICSGASRGVSKPANQICTWPNRPFTGGVVFVDAVHADAYRDTVITGAESTGAAQTKSRAGFQNHIEAIIRLIRAQAKLPNIDVHTNCTTTNGSPLILDAFVFEAAKGMPVSGTGIPAASYVGTITKVGGAITGYRLSSSPTTQTDVNATSTQVGVATLTYAPVRTGTWTTNSASPENSGGKLAFTNAAGASVRYYFTIPTAGLKATFVTLATDDNASGLVTSPITISYDGGSTSTLTVANKSKKSGTGPNYGSGQACWSTPALSAGVHYIDVVQGGSAGQYMYDDCVLIESPSPLTVILNKTHQLTAAGYTAGGGDWATDQLYNGYLDTVAALFPADDSVIVCDPLGPSTGFVPATHLGPDGTHPNALAEQLKHDNEMAVLNSLDDRIGLSRAQ